MFTWHCQELRGTRYWNKTWHSSTPQNLEDPCHFPNSSDLVSDNLLPSSDIFGVIHCRGGGGGEGREGGDSAQVEYAHNMLKATLHPTLM